MGDISLTLPDGQVVSGLWQAPAEARACLVLAHGAGAGMRHASLASIADGLETRGIATLRFQFPYMEAGSKRPDRPAVAHLAVRAAVAAAAGRTRLPLFAGGRSFGGRMTSQAQAEAPLPGVRGLVFFAFPLHPAGAPSDARAAHLAGIAVPMLFLQGTRDALAAPALLTPLIERLGPRATLHAIEAADHAFHVPARSGRNDAEMLRVALDAVAEWVDKVIGRA